MTEPPRSYKRVHYEFRPAKQVERRMFVHTFQSLMSVGFPIAEYQYTGMGSVYFIDFVLFHKYLGIKRLLSVEESEDVRKRLKFNRPFRCITVKFGDIIEYIPRLSRDLKHILWLDYDHVLTEGLLNTVHLAASQLTAGSILIVTVDAEPPGTPEDGLSKWNPRAWKAHFLTEAAEYLWPRPRARDFSKEALVSVNARLIETALERGLLGRPDVFFYPLFNLTYADGHRMLSLGGMIGTEQQGRCLTSLDRKSLYFLRNSLSSDPYEIVVPLVTRRERLYLDNHMPCRDGWEPSDFEMSREAVSEYRAIYRYYPAYTEMLL